jgi:hypothetical protein
MATSTLSDWWFNRVTRLGRLITKVNKEQYRPMPNASRSYYTSVLWVLEGIMGIDYFFFAYVYWYPAWLGLWPFIVTAAFLVINVSGYFLLELWVENAPKCRPGLLELFTSTDESINIQPALYIDGKGVGKVCIYQMKLLGGLLGNWLKGTFVLISRVLEDEVETQLTNEYNKTKVLGSLPKDKTLGFGRKWGDIMDVPGDLEYYVLGNENDGLEEEVRNWIKRTYHYWSPLWVVMIGRDVLEVRKSQLKDASPVTHRTGHDSALADAQREAAYWKGKHEEIVRQGSRVVRIVRKGRGPSVPEEAK